ncbi:MAG: molybdenum cofactor guanylyltransferase [Rhodocyclaceae bacterium]|nr:molybdenum cofactor guanylyltransferase [Rhodocyclaceae bacterium]
MISLENITGLVLAGGMGRRMGGADKGLLLLHGRPLAALTLARLKPQVGRLFISANRNLEAYAALGAEVLPDLLPDYPGPLAGIHAALARIGTHWLATSPCDSPDLPSDLVARLMAAALAADAPLAVARTAGRSQPAFMLCRRELLPSLTAYLESGQRRVGAWQASEGAAQADFDDCAEAFANFNTPEDLAARTTP